MSLPASLVTTLHILPLLSTTASLTHAYMENITTAAFLHPPPTATSFTRTMAKTPTTPPPYTADATAAKDVVVPIWFVNFFHVGVWSVIGLNTVSQASAAANLYLFAGKLERADAGLGGSSKMWYGAGLVAALAHYAFVPAVAGSVERLYKMCVAQAKGEPVPEEQRGGAVKALAEWNARHRVRMGTVDVCAWVCFAVGVVGVLTP